MTFTTGCAIACSASTTQPPAATLFWAQPNPAPRSHFHPPGIPERREGGGSIANAPIWHMAYAPRAACCLCLSRGFPQFPPRAQRSRPRPTIPRRRFVGAPGGSGGRGSG
jgi:hypothetical protein